MKQLLYCLHVYAILAVMAVSVLSVNRAGVYTPPVAHIVCVIPDCVRWIRDGCVV